MIAHLTGTVAAVAPDAAVIEVGGVGLQVQCAPATIAGLRVGDQARVATSLVVREDSLTLYGFASDDERNTFELLQTASGVGPRLALAMLAVLTPDALRRAVAAEDLATLTSVPGIGRKGAQRIVLELAGRLGAPGDGQSALTAGRAAPSAAPAWREQVRAGLVSLGWQVREADQAIAVVEPELLAAGAAGLAGPAVAAGPALAAGSAVAGNGGGPGAEGDGSGGAGGGPEPAIDVAVALRAALRVLSRS
jgi:holliday junction DNA helicase RuvA